MKQINNIVGLAPGCYVVHERHNVRVTEFSDNYIAALGLTDEEITKADEKSFRWKSNILADCPIFLQADMMAHSIKYIIESYSTLKERFTDSSSDDILEIHKYTAGILNDVVRNEKICDAIMNELMEAYHAEEGDIDE